MTLREQFENAGSTVKFIEDTDTETGFLVTADDYSQFKTLLEIVEVYVATNNYDTIFDVTYSGGLYKGAFTK